MKYIKMLGLAAVAAAALMAVVGASVASATILTAPEGKQLLAGSTISATNEQTVILHPPFGAIECTHSAVSGKTTNSGGAAETVKGNIEALSFSGCNATVTVLQKGTLEVHTRTAAIDGNGTLTSNGTEVTVEFIGFHCIFKTNNTDIGTLTGFTNALPAGGKHATFDISATIPRTGGRSGAFCGSTAQWTGSYKINTPTELSVD